MKKKLTIAGVIVLVLALGALGTWAAFNAVGRATNVITTGTIKMALAETSEDTYTEIKEGDTVIGMQFDNILPGQEVSKIPTITNIGTGDFYLRVKVDTVVKLADGGEETIDWSAENPIITINYDSNNWQYKNGWFYYVGGENGIVTPTSDVTVFTEVGFAPSMNNTYQNSSVTMTIQGEAVQVKNQNVSSPMDAIGWPSETPIPQP